MYIKENLINEILKQSARKLVKLGPETEMFIEDKTDGNRIPVFEINIKGKVRKDKFTDNQITDFLKQIWKKIDVDAK
jgi:hypothetical protein